jgi:hypothetical protein
MAGPVRTARGTSGAPAGPEEQLIAKLRRIEALFA